MINKETDVVVVGYGGAGAAAAIAAHDAGARVIMLEKNAEGGGNTQYSGGTIREYLDVDKASAYIKSITYGSVDDDMIRGFVQECMKNPDWMRGLGAELGRTALYGFPDAPHVIFPHLPGADGVGGRFHVKDETGGGFGGSIWAILCRNVEKRAIETLFNTPAKRLVLNENREVVGVVADGPDGEVTIKARRGVILTCGGFEFNYEMQDQYLALRYGALGNPGNTGDGIRMAQEIGADLWHMGALACTVAYKIPEIEAPVGQRMTSGGFIYVDQLGKRFVDETGTDSHAFHYSLTFLDFKTLTYPRLPAYTIFDEDTRRAGPIATGNTMLMGRWTNFYNWSDDNLAEIEKGWIQKADTIAELSRKIGIRPENLQETVSQYNINCIGGYDPDFGRRPDHLIPIVRSPFYGIATWPCLFNTQGGPKRNAQGQILNTHGEPIKRLFSAGEIGSMWGIIYPGAGNVSECLASGRIAGRNAAAEKPSGK
jgi:succinate dehydrogenase/fumarate reductase flavoprotein subunit